MHLEHSPARAAYTVAEFCAAHRISRSKFYQLLAEGRGPRCFYVGVKRLISFEAAAAWRAEREAEALKRSSATRRVRPVRSSL
jgi:hypothetical protein